MSQLFEAYSDTEFRAALAEAETIHAHAPSAQQRRRRLLADAETGLPNLPPDMKQGYPDGHRTRELTRRAGWYAGPKNASEADAQAALQEWNQYNDPPLSEEKVIDTVASIYRSEARKREANGQASAVVPQSAQPHEPEPYATFKRLASLPSFAYDQVRIKEAEQLGVRVSTLDDEVEKLRPGVGPSAGGGRPLELSPPPLWPTQVHGPELLNDICCRR
jgi:Primase C terminal 1 (PriCT-1)